jgi:hypothetical protein
MKSILFFVLVFLMSLNAALAQDNQTQTTTADELPRFEVGAQFSSLNRDGEGGRNGFGGRFTYNFNKYLAAEAEGNLYPGREFNGRAAQAVFGVKAGKRWNKFGIFGKARPGFLYTSASINETFATLDGTNFTFRSRGTTDFALDVGGVLEFYPTKNLVTRFDFGDTIVRQNSRNINFATQNPTTGRFENSTFTLPSQTRHYFQFNAGIGFRF